MSTLIEKIKKLENESLPLDVQAKDRGNLLKMVNSYTEECLTKYPKQDAYSKNGYDKNKEDEVLEINGEQNDLNLLLHILQNRVDNTGLNTISGGHLGYIPSGGIYASALADYIAAITNRYSGVFYASPGTVRIENVLIRWVGKLIGYTGNFGGNTMSGGSLANLVAIAAARSAFKLKGKDLATSVIYICQQAHHSILKALMVTGLDECVLRVIETDDHYRMNLKILQEQLEKDTASGLRPFVLFANAGSTDSGAIDPLEEMAAIAQQYKLWFHVDGAYGGFFLLTEEGKEKMKGIHLADSVVLDPHKGLFLPYGSGMVMVKNVQHLYDANNFDANYMQDAVDKNYEYSPSQLSPELSRHFRGLRMWLPIKLYGTKPFVANLDEKLLLTKYFYEKVRQLGYKTGPPPDLSVVMFWYEPKGEDANTYNKKVLKTIQEDGRIFISSTHIKEKFLLRFVVLSFRTHLEHVDLLLNQLEDCVQKK